MSYAPPPSTSSRSHHSGSPIKNQHPQYQQEVYYVNQQQQQQPAQQVHSQSPYSQPQPTYYNPYSNPPASTSEPDFFRPGMSTQLGLQFGAQMINAGQDYVNKNVILSSCACMHIFINVCGFVDSLAFTTMDTQDLF